MAWICRRLRSRRSVAASLRLFKEAGLEQAAALRLGDGRWVATAGPCETTQSLDPFDGVHGQGPLGGLPRWLGLVPYEALRTLEGQDARYDGRAAECREEPLCTRVHWARYPALVVWEGQQAWVAGESLAAIERLRCLLEKGEAAPLPRLGLSVCPSDSAAAHGQRIERAIALILRGDLYQVNMARRLELELKQGDALDLFVGMNAHVDAPFAAYLELDGGGRCVSTSPELLLRATVDAEGQFKRLMTEPIKGTIARGNHADDDRRQAMRLEQDPKERAELAMIVDVERNDLGAVARFGSVRIVRPARVVRHPTVFHRQALLAAAVRPGVRREEVFAAMLPSGSVTGAPKVRAMQVIAQLEAHRRGLYTGAIGTIAHDGSTELSMAIRCAVVRGKRGHYFSGGGIVAASQPAREVEETRLKAMQLTQLGEVLRAGAGPRPQGS